MADRALLVLFVHKKVCFVREVDGKEYLFATRPVAAANAGCRACPGWHRQNSTPNLPCRNVKTPHYGDQLHRDSAGGVESAKHRNCSKPKDAERCRGRRHNGMQGRESRACAVQYCRENKKFETIQCREDQGCWDAGFAA